MSELSGKFTVVSWNILFYHLSDNKVKPQSERYKNCAQTLLLLGKELDIVTLCEVENSDTHGSHGAKIAELTENKHGFWKSHSRQNEEIGMFGNMVDNVNFIKLDNDKTAATTRIGSVCIAGVHLTFDLLGSARRSRQIQVVLDHMMDKKQAVIMGDFNCLPWQKPRKLIEKHGFRSVFSMLGQKQPPTAPTKEYSHLLKKWERFSVGRGLSIDDIYVKGLSVLDAGAFEGASDHYGVWATLKT